MSGFEKLGFFLEDVHLLCQTRFKIGVLFVSDMRSLHIDRIAIDSARGVVLEIRGGDSGFFVGLHKTAILHICRMNGKVLSGDFSRSRLRKASCRCKRKCAGSFQFSLIVDVSPKICREVSSCMEIAEVFCSSFVGEAAVMEREAHISVGREIAGKGHGARFNGEVSAALDRGVLDVERIFDGEGNIPVACNLTALCMKVLGRKRKIVSAEELCAVIAEFFCHDCERADIVRFARGSDGGSKRAFVDDGSSMNRRIRFADDLAAVVKRGGRDVFFRAVLCLYVDFSAIDSASGGILELCGMENCFFLRLNKTVIFYICRIDMEMLC